MDNRQHQGLDRYITGNYGEDQFKGSEDYPDTAHAHYQYVYLGLYEYDSANDGPECEVITRILAADWYYEIDKERLRT